MTGYDVSPQGPGGFLLAVFCCAPCSGTIQRPKRIALSPLTLCSCAATSAASEPNMRLRHNMMEAAMCVP